MRARLCVELGGLKPRWVAWCVRHEITSGEGVRQLVAAALDEEASSSRSSGAGIVPRWTSVDAHRERIEIRLLADELDAVSERAAAAGFSANRWIVALIRAQLAREPQFGSHEMQLLAQSNQHLAVLYTMLGRRSDAGRGQSAGRVPEDIVTAIEAHLHVVNRLLRANLDRWSR